MKSLTLAITLVVVLHVAGALASEGQPAEADPFSAGVAAYGRGDVAGAAALFRAAAERGEAAAAFNLGILYETGQGVEKNPAQAAEWYRKAAAQGDADAAFNLAVLHHVGRGVPLDLAAAAAGYRKAAEKGLAVAERALGDLYRQGLAVTLDPSEALRWYGKAAVQGDAKAIHALAVMSAAGEGAPRDPIAALKWGRIAVARGSAETQPTVDRLVKEISPADVAKANAAADEWTSAFERRRHPETTVRPSAPAPAPASGGGAVPAAVRASGKPGEPPPPPDFAVVKAAIERGETDPAVNQLKLLAVRGEAEAQVFLASLYIEGRGVAQNDSIGWRWYVKAANTGNAEAQYQLGRLNENGLGVPVFAGEAMRYYEKAATAGHEAAIRRLVTIYRRGIGGILRDETKALEWEAKLPKPAEAPSASAAPAAPSTPAGKAAALPAVPSAPVIDPDRLVESVVEAISDGDSGEMSLAQQTEKIEGPLAALVQDYVAAVNAHSIERLKQRAHPRSLACITDETRADYDSILGSDFTHAIPEGYEARVRALKRASALPFDQMLDYPVRPTHLLRVRFGPRRDTTTLLRFIRKDGEQWFLVIPCFKPGALDMVRARNAVRDGQP